MKRVGYIYEKVYSIENLNNALDCAARGKRNQRYVRKILDNRDYYIQKLHDDLKNQAYTLNPNIHKTIVESSNGKTREITVPKFYPDLVLQWAVCLQLQPIFMRGMYRYCCGSIPQRGNTDGKKYIDDIISNDTKARYILKLDIKKFFQSIYNEKLKELLREKIKDEKLLRLLYAIIDNGGEGLPIGYYTSQWLSNFYLEKLDHYIKEELKIRHYVRYVDDMVLIDSNKRKLHNALNAISQFLADNNYGVVIKDNCQLWKINTRPLDFLGYRFYADKTYLRKRMFISLNRRVAKIERVGYCTVGGARGMSALLGWLHQVPNGDNYYSKHIKPTITRHEISNIISYKDRLKRQGVLIYDYKR